MNTRFAFVALLTAVLLAPVAHAVLDGVTLAPQFQPQAGEPLPPLVRGASDAPMLQANRTCADFNIRRQWVETKLVGWAAALDAHDCRATPGLAENAPAAADLFGGYGDMGAEDVSWNCLNRDMRGDSGWREPYQRMARRITDECPMPVARSVRECADSEFREMLAKRRKVLWESQQRAKAEQNEARQHDAWARHGGGGMLGHQVDAMSNIKRNQGRNGGAGTGSGKLDAIIAAELRGDVDAANRFAAALYAQFEAKCRRRHPATPNVSIEEL